MRCFYRIRVARSSKRSFLGRVWGGDEQLILNEPFRELWLPPQELVGGVEGVHPSVCPSLGCGDPARSQARPAGPALPRKFCLAPGSP